MSEITTISFSVFVNLNVKSCGKSISYNWKKVKDKKRELKAPFEYQPLEYNDLFYLIQYKQLGMTMPFQNTHRVLV